MDFQTSLRDYLIALGHGPFALDNLPDQPRDVIVIYDQGGTPPELNEHLPGGLQTYEIQFRARNKNQADARAALLAIQEDLHRLSGNLGDFTIRIANAVERPSVLTRDAKDNWHLISTYEIQALAN